MSTKGMEYRPVMDRFWEKVEQRGADECWPWVGHVNRNGYGYFWLAGRLTTAHRASLILHGRPVPPGYDACHHCDVRACVNPSHLFVGTRRDNMLDAKRKGRIRYTAHAGSANGYAKLTEADIPVIRELHDSGMLGQDIAARFGVSPSAISDVLLGQTWTSVLESMHYRKPA